jgi:hypothetical protein
MLRDRQEKIWMCLPCADDEAIVLQMRFPTWMSGERFKLYGLKISEALNATGNFSAH